MKDFLLQNAHDQFTGDRVSEIKNSIPTGAVIRDEKIKTEPMRSTEYFNRNLPLPSATSAPLECEDTRCLTDATPTAEDGEKALVDYMLSAGAVVEASHANDPGLDGDELNTMPPNVKLNRKPRMPVFKTHDGVSFYQIGASGHLIDGVKISRNLDSDKTLTMRLQVPIRVDDLVLLEEALTKFVNGELDSANFVYKKSEELLLAKQLEVIFNHGCGKFMKDENAAHLFGNLIRSIDNIAFRSTQTDECFKRTVGHVDAIMAAKQNARFVGGDNGSQKRRDRIALDPRNPHFTLPDDDVAAKYPNLRIATAEEVLGLPPPSKGHTLVKYGEHSFTEMSDETLTKRLEEMANKGRYEGRSTLDEELKRDFFNAWTKPSIIIVDALKMKSIFDELENKVLLDVSNVNISPQTVHADAEKIAELAQKQTVENENDIADASKHIIKLLDDLQRKVLLLLTSGSSEKISIRNYIKTVLTSNYVTRLIKSNGDMLVHYLHCTHEGLYAYIKYHAASMLAEYAKDSFQTQREKNDAIDRSINDCYLDASKCILHCSMLKPHANVVLRDMNPLSVLILDNVDVTTVLYYPLRK